MKAWTGDISGTDVYMYIYIYTYFIENIAAMKARISCTVMARIILFNVPLILKCTTGNSEWQPRFSGCAVIHRSDQSLLSWDFSGWPRLPRMEKKKVAEWSSYSWFMLLILSESSSSISNGKCSCCYNSLFFCNRSKRKANSAPKMQGKQMNEDKRQQVGGKCRVCLCTWVNRYV